MSLKQKTFKGVIWSAVERFSTQGVQFLFGILLARLLTPNDYGMIAMLTIFMAVSQTFIDSGFGNALIRKPDRNENDKATVFFFNIFMAAACYAAIFLAAPYVAQFYNMPQLADILRILAINLIIQAFGSIQRLNLTIDLNFKMLAKISFSGAVVGGTAGLICAYNGLGVWSLVVQQMTTTSFRVLLFWGLVRWRPKSFFNKTSFKNMFGFGSKLLASGLLNTLYENIYDLIIGKFFSASTLGNYSRASHFANFPSSNITGIFQRVTFPVLSKIQDDPVKLRKGYLKFLNMSTLVIFPLMIGLAALAKPFILLVLTEKWANVILILQIICIAHMWHPVHAINLNVLQVMGRSDLLPKTGNHQENYRHHHTLRHASLWHHRHVLRPMGRHLLWPCSKHVLFREVAERRPFKPNENVYSHTFELPNHGSHKRRRNQDSSRKRVCASTCSRHCRRSPILCGEQLDI
jgi:Membrane protein involved in the export of O-antigen and teichoic acid